VSTFSTLTTAQVAKLQSIAQLSGVAILSASTQTYDDNFTKWTASAKVEYINSVGGVDRTNIQFSFGALRGQPAWRPVPN
jgi:hypothetical protein